MSLAHATGAGDADAVPLVVNGARLEADPSGALWWADLRTLVVADLHLEKGSAFARHGRFLPPYDTAATLERLEALVHRLAPATVVCLGDSFHDDGAPGRLAPADRARLLALAGRCDWIWVAGNHDPAPPRDCGGRAVRSLVLGPLAFRHRADGNGAGELSGHFHPKATVWTRHRRIGGRCFVTDGRRMILPAFGAYAGGLDVRDPAISGLFPRGFRILLQAAGRLFPF